MGDTVYFLSDRNGAVTLFSYDTRTKAVKQAVENKGLDLKSLSAVRMRWSTNNLAGCTCMTLKKGKRKKSKLI